jgi:hypothetical protein
LRVVTTPPDLWAITRAIVGDAGDVQVATRPGQNPHDAVARQAGMALLVLPQSPGAVRGTEDYVAHMDHLVSALARTLGGK